jgi:hypothetical protein
MGLQSSQLPDKLRDLTALISLDLSGNTQGKLCIGQRRAPGLVRRL